MKRKGQFVGLLALVLFAGYSGCRKLYTPPPISAPNSFLVVEGGINSGADSTIIQLSRTVNLSNVNTPNPVTGATVAVEGDQNSTYPLRETSAGKYVAVGLNLDNSHKYRLSIKTSSNQYVSDYEAVLNSPPIDSIHYQVTPTGLNILSNTHDPKKQVQYYRWDYGETWIIHSRYVSNYYSNGDTVLLRSPGMEIYTCWERDSSSTIVINSSARLSTNEIVDNPITFIPSTSPKIGSEYSILVRQYALSADAYVFWTNLKKNTEQLGSIFDPQPSQINGNIHSVTNPNEAVIGYISVGATSTARIFIQARLLPAWLPIPEFTDCALDTFYYKFKDPGSNAIINQVDLNLNPKEGAVSPEIPVAAIAPPGSPPIGFTASSAICVDCTLIGTNRQPPFWK